MPIPKEIEQATILLKDKSNLLHNYKKHAPGCGATVEDCLKNIGDDLVGKYSDAQKAFEYFQNNHPDKPKTIAAAKLYVDYITDQAKLIVGLDEALKGPNRSNIDYLKLKVKLHDGKDVFFLDSLGYAVELKSFIQPSEDLKNALNQKLSALKSDIKLAVNELKVDRSDLADIGKALIASTELSSNASALDLLNRKKANFIS